jgi:hypothetical protein
MGCRNCGTPLPGDQATGACPACGTLYGERAELEEYAAAVISGLPVERPKAIATPRLKVRFKRGASDGTTPLGDGSLDITLRYFSPRTLLAFLLGLLALAGLAYIWQLALTNHSYVVAGLVSVPVGFYVWVRVTALFDGLVVRLAGGKLQCSQSRFWPRTQVRLPTADIVQLFTVQAGGAFSLLARTANGKSRLLVRNIGDAELGVYLERQLELALGVADQPVQSELPRGAALPKRASRVRPFLVEIGLLGLFVVAPVFGMRACGVSMAELAVGDQPKEASFVLDRSGPLFFTANIHLVSHHFRGRSQVPRVMTFQIEILQGDRSVTTLSCDPFDVDVWTSGGGKYYVDSFWGPMSHCTVKLPAGRYTLRAVRRWKPGAKRVVFEESVLELRRE